MTFPTFIDTFQGADDTNISGRVSDSGHVWNASGAAIPDMIDNHLAYPSGGSGSCYAFMDVLGKSPKQAIWVFLIKDFKVNRNELPENIRVLDEGLQKIFGLGYRFLDTLFCRYLEKATGKTFSKDQNFCERVEFLCYGSCKSENTEK